MMRLEDDPQLYRFLRLEFEKRSAFNADLDLRNEASSMMTIGHGNITQATTGLRAAAFFDESNIKTAVRNTTLMTALRMKTGVVIDGTMIRRRRASAEGDLLGTPRLKPELRDEEALDAVRGRSNNNTPHLATSVMAMGGGTQDTGSNGATGSNFKEGNTSPIRTFRASTPARHPDRDDTLGLLQAVRRNSILLRSSRGDPNSQPQSTQE